MPSTLFTFTLLPFIPVPSAPVTTTVVSANSSSIATSASQQLCGETIGNYNSTEKQAILDYHNNLRSTIAQGKFTAKGQLMPAAANMRQLTWDCDLEKSAQEWANRCVFEHSHIAGLGENLYTLWSTAQVQLIGSGPAASKAWANEFQDFGWKSITLTLDVFNTGIGHATQMAWADTSKVGCGATLCDGGNRVIVVCHYKSQGNILTYNAYQPGPSCSACPANSSCGINGLCQ